MVCAAKPKTETETSTQLPVLIVEDERMSRRAMTALLERCGFRPQPYGSAEEALGAVLSGSHPRFALVDLDLPGMNGLDLISRLEALDPSIFPILITATDQEILSRKLHDRPVTYLRKPVNFDSLLDLMTERRHRH
jgi:two-component system C4-dicarboxylate transport response regulator DctD